MSASGVRSLLGERLQAVEARIAAACRRAGRPRGDVTLVAVTKTVSAEVAAVLPELGVPDLGESRPQDLWRKAALLPAGVRWHLIGHLQRNKIARTLPLVYRIHSADSVRLLEALNQEAGRLSAERPVEVLLEVNASREPNKNGFAPEELPGQLAGIMALPHVRVLGLMTMAAWAEDPEDCRPTFAALRQLREQLRGRLGAEHPFEDLSMGMSHDFEVAIEEGATLVRIGTALFDGLAGGDG